MTRHRSGFTLIEMLIVVVVIGILSAIAIPKFQNMKGRARSAALRADLRNLATAQEEYLSTNMVYANTTGLLGFHGSEGNTITIVQVVPGGWSATTTHPLSLPIVCAIYYGNAAPLAPATQEGRITCA